MGDFVYRWVAVVLVCGALVSASLPHTDNSVVSGVPVVVQKQTAQAVRGVDYPKIDGTYLSLYYDEAPMQRVYRVRLRQGIVRAGWTGWMGASPYCQNINRVMLAQFKGSQAVEEVLIIDCAEPYDLRMQLATSRGLEVSYGLAQKYGFVSNGHAWFTMRGWKVE